MLKEVQPMKFNLKNNLLSNPALKVVSLIIGYGIWHVLSAHHMHTLAVEVPVCFYNEVAAHEVDAPATVRVELQGARKILRALNTQSLALHVDAATLRHGPNQLRVDHTTLFVPNSITVVHYSPANSTITVKEKNCA